MSTVAAAGTAEATAPGEFNLDTVIADINAEPEGAEATTEEGDEAEAEPDKPAKDEKAKPAKAEAKAEAKPGKFEDDFVVSKEKPWTAERAKASLEAAKALAESAQKQWATEQKRTAKLDAKRAAYLQEKQQFTAVRDQLAANFQAMRTGDVRQRIEALGMLFGGDGMQLLEQFNLELARGGKKAEMTPAEKALQDRLDRIERAAQEREQREQLAAQRQQQEAFLAQRKEQLAELGSDPESYPLLSEFSREEIANGLVNIIHSVHTDTGKIISDAEAARMIEQDLEQREAQRQQRRAERGAPQGAAGLVPRAASAAKPAQAQSSPPNRGRSLAPRLSTQSLTTRELDDEEGEDAADFIPPAFLNMGSM